LAGPRVAEPPSRVWAPKARGLDLRLNSRISVCSLTGVGRGNRESFGKEDGGAHDLPRCHASLDL
jgi:hypothetical protein